VRQGAVAIMKASHIKCFLLLLLGCLALRAPAASAMANQVSREQDIVGLRLGQHIQVDDGSCPAGQIKEISGAKMSPTGILAAIKCVPRLGIKRK
jgi:hypothetical protein